MERILFFIFWLQNVSYRLSYRNVSLQRFAKKLTMLESNSTLLIYNMENKMLFQIQ